MKHAKRGCVFPGSVGYSRLRDTILHNTNYATSADGAAKRTVAKTRLIYAGGSRNQPGRRAGVRQVQHEVQPRS